MGTIMTTSHNSEVAALDLASDDGLRVALTRLVRTGTFAGTKLWEQIGHQVINRAERDGRDWHRHAMEYVSAYTFTAIEYLRTRPEQVINARSPWGLVVTKGRSAGKTAVGAELSGGLTDRDPITHHVRFSVVPRVVSWDVLGDGSELRIAG